jgi:hypothetical protein
MLKLANILIAVLAVAASILQIFSFFRERLRHKIALFIAGLALSAALVGFVWWGEKIHAEQKSKGEIERRMLADARVVADSIVISGWEDGGDFIGYLSQAAGFYSRYKDRFPVEAETSKNELLSWQNELRRLRTGGHGSSSSDWGDLRGLVRTYRNHLNQVAESIKNGEP